MNEDLDLCYFLWLFNGELGDNQKFYNKEAEYARKNYFADVAWSPENRDLINEMLS